MANAITHQRNIIEIQKPVEVFYLQYLREEQQPLEQQPQA